MEKSIEEKEYKRRYPLTSMEYGFQELRSEEKRGLKHLIDSDFQNKDRLALGILSMRRDWAPRLPGALARFKNSDAQKRFTKLLKDSVLGSKDWPSLPDLFDEMCLRAKYLSNFDHRSLDPYERVRGVLASLRNITKEDLQAIEREVGFKPYVTLPRFEKGQIVYGRRVKNPLLRNLERSRIGPRGNPNKQKIIVWLRDFFCYQDNKKEVRYESKKVGLILEWFGMKTGIQNILRTLKERPITHPQKPIHSSPLKHRYPGERTRPMDEKMKASLEEGRRRYGTAIETTIRKNTPVTQKT